MQPLPHDTERLKQLRPDVTLAFSHYLRWLRFSPALESHYQAVTAASRLARWQLAGWLGVLLYALFAIGDYYSLSDVYQQTWTVRFGFVIPCMALSLLALRWRQMERWCVALMGVSLALVGLSVLYIPTLSTGIQSAHYHIGILLVIFYASLLVRFPFWYGAAGALLMGALYPLALDMLPGLNDIARANYVLIVWCGIAVSLLASYQLEYDGRRDFLLILRHQLVADELAVANERLEFLLAQDSLTGLPNHRAFDEQFERAWRHALRDGEALSVAFVDVDHFKAYNDCYGHAAGDECLARIAGLLKETVRRPFDMVARFGGEKFVVLLPGNEAPGAREMAEAVRRVVSEANIENVCDTARRITVSVGLATVTPVAGLESGLALVYADEALYRAKENGRNRVEVWGEAG